jgi:general secretion pathway protein A
MSYYKILAFDKEPFSTSPDPDFFYLSREHETALTNILIEVRLRRGLSVIMGDVGTGKTSLSRKLIQELRVRDDIIFHIVLDPFFENESMFLSSILRNLDIQAPASPGSGLGEMREALERFLFQKGVTENKTVVLIIDEAQKLDPKSLEVLRILLNYETNKFKLLQLVLLGQLELYSKISTMQNFYDRISFRYTLNPLDLDETREMIGFRVRQAGYHGNMRLFMEDAVREIYAASRGYPRQVTMLCHKALKNLVLRKRYVVDAHLIRELVDEETRLGWQRQDAVLQKSSY